MVTRELCPLFFFFLLYTQSEDIAEKETNIKSHDSVKEVEKEQAKDS